ncbi:MAG: type 1 glutamine amidotransferase-like domain-containing protein [Bdellovibrionaceae bacterium]|jgi:dipeptidase E|nr:type 1 glutamine amidotransferase-like domain-containing protein [Pseudobdellovibrionaceae bacterium]
MKDCKLVFYSGGQLSKNQHIHKELVRLVGNKKKITMTYVPFCHDNHKIFFARAIKRYAKFGVTDFHCLPVDIHVGPAKIKKLVKSDIIYLAGGNTYYFLKYLRKSKVFHSLRDYVKNGGVLGGLSAGGIIMSPHIELAGYPSFDHHADENEVGLKRKGGLNLVNFEFYPHYTSSPRLDKALKDYSLQSKYPIIACHDGSGVVVEGKNRQILGEFKIFHRGQKI